MPHHAEQPGSTRADPARPGEAVDVLDVSDLRFPGGTSHSIAEEVRAQHAAGYRTGLVHVNGPLITRTLPVSPRIRRLVEDGAARLEVSGAPLRARLVVVRHPAVVQHGAAQLPPVHCEELVLVANAPSRGPDGTELYDPVAAGRAARAAFGREPRWAPIGPDVRADLAAHGIPAAAMTDEDWVNVIDAAAWWRPRPAPDPSRPPVVGRHSRPSPQKWPSDPEVLRQVYPVDGSLPVRVLGGADPVRRLLGRVPPAWEVHEFGSLDAAEFLAGVDVFVYFHDPGWREAFGRTVLEAMAAGVPAVLPRSFEPLFGDAALYADPPRVRGLVQELWADPQRYAEQVARGRRAAEQRFGHAAHQARVEALIGPPGGGPPGGGPAGHPQDGNRPTTTRSPAAGSFRAVLPRVLMVSSNGAGMGHLTRLLAYATRLEGRADVSFLSLSQAVPLVGRLGFAFEYLPSAAATGMPTARWRELFRERTVETLRRVRPDVVVFDGTVPYAPVPAVRDAAPGPRWVWSRRGMWREGANAEVLERAAWFDAVLEPGDLAGEGDRGVTAGAPAHRVGPVTLLDPGDLDDRDAAREALGLPAEGPLALLTLGAGAINDVTSDVGAATAALEALGVGVCLPRNELGADVVPRAGVHQVRAFPLSRHLAAFDVAVSAAGYNSFHELLRFGVPTLFVPNAATALDDQAGRAAYAAGRGWAHTVPHVDAGTAGPLLADLLERGREMVAEVRAHDPGNGAAAAADLVAGLAGAGPAPAREGTGRG